MREFGAVGDGEHKDTEAVQAAIDACHDAGGGRVHVDAGRYLIGTIALKSRVELHLRSGAVLVGSPDRDDYNPDDVFPENHCFRFEHVSGAHLVLAYRAEDVSITGPGTIDGNSAAFFGPPESGRDSTSYRFKPGNYAIPDWRPGQMVFFSLCRRVTVRDVSLLNSPYWTLLLHGCEACRIRGLRIENPPQTRNGDGIDIDCCRDVTVSDCIVSTGDDSITLRGNTEPLGEDRPCENVVVTNCVLRSPCNALRVGVGNGTIQRCRLSNIVVADARIGINFVCRYPRTRSPGTHIEDIQLSNFTINAVTPFHMNAGEGARPPAGIHNVSLSGFSVAAQAGAYLGGEPDLPLTDITLRNWALRVEGGTDNTEYRDEVPLPFPPHGATGINGRTALPAAIFGRRLERCIIDGLAVRWAERLGRVWRDGLWFDRVRGLRLRNLDVRPPSPEGEAIRYGHVTDVDSE